MPTLPDREPPRENRFEGSAIVELLGRLARAQESTPVELSDTPPAVQLLRAAPALLWELGEFLIARVNEAGVLGQMVEAVKAPQPASVATSGANGRSYEETRGRFSELEAKLREQSNAVERLVGPPQPDNKALLALHHALVLTCPQGGKARGQIRCLNKTGREAFIDVRARALHGATGTLNDAMIACQPNGKRLAPEEAALFAIAVDLTSHPETSNETLKTSVDIYLNDELTLKVFVSVEVQANVSGAGERPATASVAEKLIPTLELHDIDAATLRILQSVQRLLLKHPIAFQAAYSALIAEGRQFEKTPEGRALKARLDGSSLVQQLRYVFDLTTFSLLERDEPEALPSAYADTLFMLASSNRSDDILDRLFGR